MNTLFVGQNIIRVEQTDSTNSHLTRLLENEKFPEGAMLITQKQVQGRGQRGATWESEPNQNLTLSILLQPTFLLPDEQFQLNKAISLGVMEMISNSLSFGEGWGEAKIKWPNDIYISNKKVAGILIENSVSGKKLQQSIIGIGINVNQEKFSAKLPNPTALKLVTGKEFDLGECLEQLCSCIESRYLQLRSPSSVLPIREEAKQTAIDSDYLKSLYRFSEWASYKFKGEIVEAKITGVTKLGKLVLETKKEKILECDFKEVEFCK
ncbi:MAG: biotin--[acetyl-CoA-carboxylase] ligase [Bacteroidetes bacterium]|nr:biotin--[acetyl-CoA-carboxylase] ligase [Bacteroidota bacterium]